MKTIKKTIFKKREKIEYPEELEKKLNKQYIQELENYLFYINQAKQTNGRCENGHLLFELIQ